jgi:hypothetical protein
VKLDGNRALRLDVGGNSGVCCGTELRVQGQLFLEKGLFPFGGRWQADVHVVRITKDYGRQSTLKSVWVIHQAQIIYCSSSFNLEAFWLVVHGRRNHH